MIGTSSPSARIRWIRSIPRRRTRHLEHDQVEAPCRKRSNAPAPLVSTATSKPASASARETVRVVSAPLATTSACRTAASA
jgi:hypothetical protein